MRQRPQQRAGSRPTTGSGRLAPSRASVDLLHTYLPRSTMTGADQREHARTPAPARTARRTRSGRGGSSASRLVMSAPPSRLTRPSTTYLSNRPDSSDEDHGEPRPETVDQEAVDDAGVEAVEAARRAPRCRAPRSRRRARRPSTCSRARAGRPGSGARRPRPRSSPRRPVPAPRASQDARAPRPPTETRISPHSSASSRCAVLRAARHPRDHRLEEVVEASSGHAMPKRHAPAESRPSPQPPRPPPAPSAAPSSPAATRAGGGSCSCVPRNSPWNVR